MVEVANNTTPKTLQHWVARPGMGHRHQSTMLPTLRHQAFQSEVMCDVSPLKVCNVILGLPYMWKCLVVYESRHHSVIVTLGK